MGLGIYRASCPARQELNNKYMDENVNENENENENVSENENR